jgi:hypothetical protein
MWAIGFGGNISSTFAPPRPERKPERRISPLTDQADPAPKPRRKPAADNPFGYDEDIRALAGTPAKTDATGRVIREESEKEKQERQEPPPKPERKPIAPETIRRSFDLKKAPVFNNGKTRQEILLNNDPAKFEIKDNPSLKNPALTENLKQILT